MRYILKQLNKDDRFFVEAFSSTVEPYESNLKPATEADQAISWAEKLNARGSTDINRALLEAVAVADPELATYVIFLTDGRPTTGEINKDVILNNLQTTTHRNVRFFSFRVR